MAALISSEWVLVTVTGPGQAAPCVSWESEEPSYRYPGDYGTDWTCARRLVAQRELSQWLARRRPPNGVYTITVRELYERQRGMFPGRDGTRSSAAMLGVTWAIAHILWHDGIATIVPKPRGGVMTDDTNSDMTGDMPDTPAGSGAYNDQHRTEEENAP